MQDAGCTERELDLIGRKRNPYLVDYEQERQGRVHTTGRQRAAARAVKRRETQRGQGIQKSREVQGPQTAVSRPRRSTTQRQEAEYAERPQATAGRPRRSVSQRQEAEYVERPPMPVRRQGAAYGERRRTGGEPVRRSAQTAAAARARRRRAVRRQRLALGVWAVCVALLAALLLWQNKSASAAEKNNSFWKSKMEEGALSEPNGAAQMQGLPIQAYARHPEWTEDFLTPNEYSRPGEALEKVSNIFVHYTANPGTSAAQNRSYFEQQKDTHEASVSAHFIIGYDGEIIQCLPLDEIGYAVMTRNYDSVSIECCYKAKDGSFTQETYDSLVSLLAWLVDVYDLDTEDILRHYDCGGKKCPLYYTEHPDAWEQLKEDVSAQLTL